jgi:hypothetical protein
MQLTKGRGFFSLIMQRSNRDNDNKSTDVKDGEKNGFKRLLCMFKKQENIDENKISLSTVKTPLRSLSTVNRHLASQKPNQNNLIQTPGMKNNGKIAAYPLSAIKFIR